jgi:glutathione S-transferase
MLHNAKRHSGYDLLATFPKVKAWQHAMAQTGIAEKSVPADFEEAFANFYLADRTFLGRGVNFNVAPIEKAQPTAGGCCG